MLVLLHLFSCLHGSVLEKVETFEECPTRASVVGTLQPTYSELTSAIDPSTQTGVMLLEEGLEALLLRGWMIEQAQQTIDVQYFIFSADNVGLLSTAELVEAANRGVRVRLIVDDVLAHGDELLLRDIHFHPNIEVKVYNPTINIGKHWTEKSRNLISDFDGINQRMHHKALIVDGKMVVTGGRNVGDEYYDLNSDYNFRDRDVLLIGGTSSVIQSGFDFFWQDDHSVLINELLPDGNRQTAEQSWTKLRNFSCSPKYFNPVFRNQLDAMPNTLLQAAESKRLLWIDSVQYISDAPWKNETEGLGGGSITTRELLDLLGQAQKRIWIQTPYLILTEIGLGALQGAIDKGVEIKILTNSLAATDNYPAYAGYKRIRNTLLEMGVEVYEMKPNAPDVQALNGTGIPDKMDAQVGLHSKSMIIDDAISVVGTFNMDPRSANLNTESFVVVRDAELTAQMESYFATDMSERNAWPASKSNEKEAGLKRRILTFFSKLVPEALL